jgi:putative phosphoribosyl transferase
MRSSPTWCSASITRRKSAPVRFPDLESAGRELAAALSPRVDRANSVILAIVRGGVPVALQVSHALSLPLDLFLLSRLFLPAGVVNPLCVVSVAGHLSVDDAARAEAVRLGVEDTFLREASSRFEARSATCRGTRPPLNPAGKTVILIDSGVRTGTTMRTAARSVRAFAPARLVIGVPVVSAATRDAIGALADDFVALHCPEPFGNVALWYRRFVVPRDESIAGLIANVPV